MTSWPCSRLVFAIEDIDELRITNLHRSQLFLRDFASVEAQLCVLPGQRLGFLIGAQREYCRVWPNHSAVTVKGHTSFPRTRRKRWSATASFVAKRLAGLIR
jgi:hypothetical protein